MSWLNGELHDGWTSSSYAGHGVLFQNLPTEGDQGGSPLLDDGGANGDEIRWGPATVTSGDIAVTLYEDGSFESSGGAGGFSYTWWRNGVAQGDQSVIISSADAIDATITFSMPQFSVEVSGSTTAPAIDSSVSFAMPQFSVSISAETQADGVNFTMPQFSASIIATVANPEPVETTFWLAQRGLQGYKRGFNSL